MVELGKVEERDPWSEMDESQIVETHSESRRDATPLTHTKKNSGAKRIEHVELCGISGWDCKGGRTGRMNEAKAREDKGE